MQQPIELVQDDIPAVPVRPAGRSTQARGQAKTPLRRKEKHAPRIDDDTSCPAGLRPGLGTMFQDALDWLSEERTSEYQRWSSEMLRKLDAIDLQKQNNPRATIT